MRKSILSFLLVVAFASAALLAGDAYAGKGPGCGHKDKCMKCAMQAKECMATQLKDKVGLLMDHKQMLGINDKQVADIKAAKKAAIKELIQRKADVDIIMVDAKSEMYKDMMDLAAINGLIDQKYAAKAAYAKAYVKGISDIQQVLSPDQRAKWKAIVKEAEESEDCGACAGKKGKVCPITGKSLGDKDSKK